VPHAAFVHAHRHPLGERGLPHPGFTDEDRIVLAPSRENVNRALEFAAATDHRIEGALSRRRGQIRGEGFQRIGRNALGFIGETAAGRG